ncbi:MULTISPECIES: maltotransferase domain-containing protein [unclassified Bradyrhizobium]|uniref:maltotransferase domain-containing protein n=1 Tax=unclassified Bradyrhizobium TaxID=2631580 RepID=UPI00211ED861|nr:MULTISPECIES: maltotransferase domain-containing protein [unclassified Bradyrhizobium]MDD1537809.1 alpha-1,4-glucan--maltose-1-phosphate maltosyltransferase [Bradyrhizobium sp. WBOS8]MDD1587310.1 alpha-1,4-glucan--maltose-1-phosphate maltosyltransferase [Bradyrhizobium sp. WBOS4]UUO47547.1 alpha-1,4-glucan--maltose-1-phosphate maltosyltransferase [Bradyrhizobium sp. WBOS04]UUO61164.1 alpha-1,4-glucan--maltose-1-phosphate maltosyltransferase [Bradyrhizobium sp. WBOS08]
MNKTIQTVESAAAGSAFLIEDVYPAIDGGRFAVKRIAGDRVEVWADVYRDGNAVIGAALLWRPEQDRDWRREPMSQHGNDRWSGAFTPVEPGRYFYAIEAWTDEFATWSHGMARKQRTGADVNLDALEGASLLTKAHGAPQAAAAIIVRQCEDYLQTGDVTSLLASELGDAMAESQSRPDLTRSQSFPLVVDRDRARFGAWYQMMPRSQSRIPGRHGTLRDCIARVPDIAAMGFDVLYFTPIHPIGRSRRKGRNNAPVAREGEPGSPYAIGAAEGGHDALHPELGTIEDFRALVATCLEYGLELALDFAVQCSPDHPWLTQHPEWFKWRPDRSVRTADGPYSDIVIPDFASVDRVGLWNAFRDAMLFWIDHGVTIFAIDNHDTAPLAFWDWLIGDIRRRHPEVILFSKTFARPKLMKGLAKLGFAQSFTYFPWRTSRWELEQYLGELTRHPERDFYRPNLFVNTPDLLPYHLQSGEAWAFKSRLALAATLSGSYGLYSGFELLEHEATPGREEYLDSEKYQIKQRDWDQPGNIKSYIADLNRVRNDNAALQQTANLRFLGVDDGETIAFVKEAAEPANTVVIVIALSGRSRECWLPLGDVTVDAGGQRHHVTTLENLLSGEQSRIEWGGIRVRIDPDRDPALLFRCLA